jgi:hypothetical protein
MKVPRELDTPYGLSAIGKLSQRGLWTKYGVTGNWAGAVRFRRSVSEMPTLMPSILARRSRYFRVVRNSAQYW